MLHKVRGSLVADKIRTVRQEVWHRYLAANRQGAYVGATIDDMDNLNEQEKRILGQKLTALLKQ